MTKYVPYALIKLDAWPSEFRRFVEAREKVVGPLERGSAASGWRPATYQNCVVGLGYFLAWLQWSGRYCAGTEVVDYVTPKIAQTYADDMRQFGLAPPSVATGVYAMHAAVATLAPKQDIKWLMRGINHLRRQPSDRRRTGQRMQHTAAIVELGMALMRGAGDADQRHAIRRAVQFRDGLMLVFGALAVPRSGVLQLMTLKTHLVRVGDEFKIAWTAKEMKAGQPYEARLGPALSVLLDAYLMTYRPVLLARHKEPASDRTELWVTRFGTQMSQRSIYDVITTRTSVAFGESVFPHALRHGAATTLATERPDLIDIVTPLLQHRHASSRQYYNLATGIEASTSFGDALDQRRTATPAGRKLIGRLSRPAHARPTRRQNAPSDTGSAKTGPR